MGVIISLKTYPVVTAGAIPARGGGLPASNEPNRKKRQCIMSAIRHLFKVGLVSTSLMVFGTPFSSQAAVAVVGVGNGGDVFTPAVANISTGDQVIWVWQSIGIIQHNTTNLAALWGSGNHPAPFSYTNTFNTAGSFPYECSLHVVFGMTGTINVAAVANQPPTVSITNPASGAVFAAPANVTMQATAADSDGTVTNVQFRVGSIILTNDNTAPYAAVTNNLAAGSYTLFAIAADNTGATATNSISIVVDTPPSVTITNPASGTVFAAPANVTIQAAASDTDGTVTNVQFLVDANVVTNNSTAPFSAVTNNLAAGSYILSAVAADNNGLKATNTAAISVVTPVSVLLSTLPQLTPANFMFSYTANAGLSYIVQRSTNLVSPNWTTLITNTAGSSSVNFTDLNVTVSPGFYRVGRLPNP